MVIPYVIGYILDLIIGDPNKLPHPVRFIGHLINKLERVLRRNETLLKLKGLILLVLVSGVTYFITFLILNIGRYIHNYIEIFISSLFIFQILATKSLYTETHKVYIALKSGDLEDSKRQLSFLVTRDCKDMTETDIVRSTVETISENIVDGITAPLFYILLGGAPLGMFYKAVNTLDSMVGYKNKKYMDFGFFSAKFDDIINYIPARVTSIIIVFSTFILKLNYHLAFKILIRDCRKHSSPNSGYAEAPVAGALGITLGGKVSYFGQVFNKPTMGDFTREPCIEDIKNCQKIMFLTSFIFFILCLGVILLWKK